MPQDRRPLIILPLAALIAIAPLILQGCSCGHDFDFHLINWFEAARQLTHGTLHPHWAATPAWNAGEPRFVFYPPLSWLTGALLGLLMPWTWTPIAYTWIALAAAGLSFYSVVRNYVAPNAALVASAVYLANPYTLYTAYERTAYAELLAAAWLPLALHAVLRRRVSIPAVAIPVALLWLTNAPAAVMGCYAMALLVLLRLFLTGTQVDRETARNSAVASTQSRTSIALNSLTGTLLGLGFASFYLVPAAYERRFVQINFAILPGLRPQDNFLFHRTADADHDSVLHLASIVALVLISLTVITLLLVFRNYRSQSQRAVDIPPSPSGSFVKTRDVISFTREAPAAESRTYLKLTILAAIIVFMLTPLSAPLWAYLPELRFLQFPWRLLAILAVVFALSLAQFLSSFRLRPARAVIVSLLAATILTLPADRFFRQRCYPEDTVSERLAIFHSSNSGTDPTDEYTPLGADNDAANPQNPGYWLAASATSSAPSGTSPAPAPHHLALSPTFSTNLILNLRNYPAWKITRNGVPVTARLPRKDGLIAIPLPAGPSQIEIIYITLADQKIGYALSALSAIAIAALARRNRQRLQQA